VKCFENEWMEWNVWCLFTREFVVGCSTCLSEKAYERLSFNIHITIIAMPLCRSDWTVLTGQIHNKLCVYYERILLRYINCQVFNLALSHFQKNYLTENILAMFELYMCVQHVLSWTIQWNVLPSRLLRYWTWKYSFYQ